MHSLCREQQTTPLPIRRAIMHRADRCELHDRYGNRVYLTGERWRHALIKRGSTSQWGQELLVHSGNGSNVPSSAAKGSDPFPECGRAPNLDCNRCVGRGQIGDRLRSLNLRRRRAGKPGRRFERGQQEQECSTTG